ncbi:unnamed protein product [Rotaria sordida]|uniref:3CxxC-type domain-containing protein n=1 Tax=Rotaria sordida TaxID=392033 RepID=A0A815GA38_9BILA|nr:unnamed protein product [Rotaria sordida]CAF3920228.1 unnamed protein product [Rotaria sordida]
MTETIYKYKSDQHTIESMFNNGQNKQYLFYERKNIIDDNDDSGTEGIEQQLEHISIIKVNDNEDQLSIKSFGPNLDEGFSEIEIQDASKLELIKKHLELANNIPNDTKKDFCLDTQVVFHGEFARLISIPLSLYYNVHYKLFSEEEFANVPHMNLNFLCLTLDNVKVRFNCSDRFCQRIWTSMRGRISFLISLPSIGFIVLKIYGQDCLQCGAYAHALWYTDEVCRVMKNLAMIIFQSYFPDMMNSVNFDNKELVQNDTTRSRQFPHDSTQRKGKMSAPHLKEHCEACQHGLCFTGKQNR